MQTRRPSLSLNLDSLWPLWSTAILLGIVLAVANSMPLRALAEPVQGESRAAAAAAGDGSGPAVAGAADVTAIETKLSNQLGAFAASLDSKQKSSALYDLEDEERFDLRLAPLGLEGLRIDEMSEAQWEALRAALGTVLSPEGLAKAETIRSLEAEVAATEGGLFGLMLDWMRQPKRYFLSIYGEPGKSEVWGMRFDGHHLSLNWTAISGEESGHALSATPLFFGGQPREVPPELERAGLRILAAEEDLAIELITALSDAEKKQALVRFVQGSQINRPGFVGADRQLELAPPAGLSLTAMSDAQQAAFGRLLETHLGNFAAPIAEQYRSQIADARDTLRFAYAVGGDDKMRAPLAGEPLYYRIQTTDFLIEFDDTPKEANHVHVVIRSAASDFGRDTLREHYSASHSPRD